MDKFSKKPIKQFLHYRNLAFQHVIKLHQQEKFPVEINYLSKGADVRGLPPKLVGQLKLYPDNQKILRSKGRIIHAPQFTRDAINPILVNGKSDLGKLLILDAHQKTMHLGVNSTLNYLRNAGIWLTSARTSVSHVLKQHCFKCKRFNQNTFSAQPQSALPAVRTNFINPFSAVGMDYTGAFQVTDFSGHPIKAYILLFTCLTTRAVHLELVSSMSSLEFLNAFIRMCNLHGIPKVVYSDNAATFIQSGSLLSTILTNDMVLEHFVNRNI